ncbi:hypothetical protein ACFQ1Q_02915 [Winogradskyella litorisediminis]|uniref:Uncharacterized protein n=1 Tax=Winogradskyella litorisediminis TaxID=1156618 RepID=A0ABW3N394_9FLAO
MTDIIIDETQGGFLIKKLKDIFKPLVISEDIETDLVFDNDLGQGKFKILKLDRDILSLYFTGVMHQELKFKFLNTKLPVLNLIYLNKGKLSIEFNEAVYKLKENETQQFIYNSDIKEYEILTWPANTQIEFSFTKLFDFSYLNSKGLQERFKNSFENSKSLRITAPKNISVKSDSKLIDSKMVGKPRMKDLECQVYSLLNIQLEEILRK